MAGNYWEETVHAEARLVDVEQCDDGAVFAWIRANFSVSGSKIDWNRVKDTHSSRQTEDDDELASMAIDEVCRLMRPGRVVEHAGDSLSPYGVRFGTAPGTKTYRFNYRGRGQAVGFIDPSTNFMVMLRANSGEFWSAYRLGDNQFAGIVHNGYLW